MVVLLPAFVRDETWEDEDGLDAKFFECAEVRFDALGECERETACCCEQGFSRWWVVR